MGLPSPDEENVEDLPKRFSDDVLKIELSGPKHPHLSVVDVPGLFHSMRNSSFATDFFALTNKHDRPNQIPNERRCGDHSPAYRKLYH